MEDEYKTENPEIYPLHKDAFPYRAWSIMVAQNPEIFTAVVKRAVNEGKRYHINRIEFHDFIYENPAPEGFVENIIRYEDFPELKGIKTWTYDRRNIDPLGAIREVTEKMLNKNAEYFYKTAKIVKDAGYKLNVWFHTFRELPLEFYKAYGERFSVDNDFLYLAFEKILDEFLRKTREIDGLVLTSLVETKSIVDMEGTITDEDRIFRFYSIAYQICKKYGKELIIRDFGGTDSFWNAVARLPKDVTFMIKQMPTDWERVQLPIHYRLESARGFRFVTEWDLRGEYLGEGLYPYANPQYYWYNLINIKNYCCEGSVARIHWTDWRGRQQEWDTIFDVPNGLNLHVFSKAMCERSRYRSGSLKEEVLPFAWIKEWIIKNYGYNAWPDMYEVLRETPGMVERLVSCADLSHTYHTFPVTLIGQSILDFAADLLNTVGLEYVLTSKNNTKCQALMLARKVKSIDIKPDEKKIKLIRSFKIGAVFAEVHLIWILFYINIYESKSNVTYQRKEMLELLMTAVDKSQKVADEVGGGIEEMIMERIQRDLPQLKKWVINGAQGEMVVW